MLELSQTLSGHQNPIYSLVNGENASTFYSAGNDKGVVEWNLTDMAFVKVILPVQSSVYALHRHNHLLFIGQRSGSVLVFDLQKQALVTTLRFHQKAVFEIKTIISKNELLTTGEDGTIAVWSLATYEHIYSFPVISNTVRVIAVNHTETEIAVGAKDGLIRIYSAEDYSLINELSGHTLPITSLQYAPANEYLVSGSRDAQLKVWTLPDYSLLKNIPAHLFSIYSIVFHPTLPYFATCSQDKSVKIWSSLDFRLSKILSNEKGVEGHFHSINKMMWSQDGKYLISTGDDRQIKVWEFSA